MGRDPSGDVVKADAMQSNTAAAFELTDVARPMLEALDAFPDQCEQAVAIGQKFQPPPFQPTSVVMTGLGGSAIGAELLRAYLAPRCKVPIVANRSYDLPAFVGPQTLVLVCSYSGNTEETISAWQQALDRGARVLLFSTGGHLGLEAERRGVAWCKVPGGLQPRAALGLSFFPMLLALQHLGLIPDEIASIRETLDVLRRLRDQYTWNAPQETNDARRLALRWTERIPVVYGSYGPVAVVAYRWKCQINENAKGLALWNEFPELNHNESVGWSGIPDLNKRLSAVFLGTPGDPPRIRKRMQLTELLVAVQASEVETVQGHGTSLLAQLFSLIHLGDWTSFYLALARRQDPMEVRVIDHMKAELAKGD